MKNIHEEHKDLKIYTKALEIEALIIPPILFLIIQIWPSLGFIPFAGYFVYRLADMMSKRGPM